MSEILSRVRISQNLNRSSGGRAEWPQPVTAMVFSSSVCLVAHGEVVLYLVLPLWVLSKLAGNICAFRLLCVLLSVSTELFLTGKLGQIVVGWHVSSLCFLDSAGFGDMLQDGVVFSRLSSAGDPLINHMLLRPEVSQ